MHIRLCWTVSLLRPFALLTEGPFALLTEGPFTSFTEGPLTLFAEGPFASLTEGSLSLSAPLVRSLRALARSLNVVVSQRSGL